MPYLDVSGSMKTFLQIYIFVGILCEPDPNHEIELRPMKGCDQTITIAS